MTKNLQEGKKNILRPSEEPEGLLIKGYEFNDGVDYEKILESYTTTGFQASNLSQAIAIINKMRKEHCTIYLGYTSNMVTSGLRDIFRYLTEHKMIDIIVTTAGGVEEDIIKCINPFILGRFDADGRELRERGINRTGNIFVPNSRYCAFEQFLLPLLESLAKEQRETGTILTPSEFVHRLGKEINNKDSILYWAEKNKIPVFCPAIMDGSLGDMIYFYKNYKNKNFKLDLVSDAEELNNSSLGKEKTGMIILGGGVIKHSICNANLYRNGADYAVYINTGEEFDASDSGARPDEAVSWGKIALNGKSVKIFADATLVFPLIVSETFAREK